MNINMTENQYNSLIKICKKCKTEISGSMDATVNNKKICITSVNIDSFEFIEKANRREVVLNQKYIPKLINELKYPNSSVRITFHTHPSIFSTSKPSKADIEVIKAWQKASNELHPNNPTKIIEGIINIYGIAFYSYNLELNKVISIPYIVNQKPKMIIK